MKRETTRLLQFRGHIETGGTPPPLVAVTIEYELHDPTTLSVDLLLIGEEAERRAAALYLRHLPVNHLWLHSDDPHVPSVEVLGIHGFSHGGTRFSIKASAVQVGISPKPQARDLTWHVSAELTPSGILEVTGIREMSYTGDIKFRPVGKGKIEVSTSLGTFQVAEHYAHHDSEEHGNKVIHTVQRVAVTGTLHIAAGHNLHTTNEAVREEVENICTILSLCYRQPVSYYEIDYVTDPETTPDEERARAYLRRRRNALETKIRQEELIHQQGLTRGGLNRLLQAYNGSSSKKELSRAIQFLAASYKMTTLESSYFLAYSALDLVTGIAKPDNIYLLGSSKWKKVYGLLKDHLDYIKKAEGLTKKVVEQMKEKIPELRRTSGDRRITEACRVLRIKTEDLWPAEGFKDGLKKATRMRNELFHSALMESPEDLHDHLVRVRTLVERLLLKILKWPTSRIWTWYDQNLKWVNHRSDET
jgi:hypothetical protein